MLFTNLILAGMLIASPAIASVSANELTQIVEEGEVSEDSIVVSADGSEVSIVSSESESVPTSAEQQEIIDKAKAWLGQYFDSTMVMNIINWAIDSGLIIIIAGIYFKFRKYKALSSIEISNKVNEIAKETIKAEFEKLSVEKLQSLVSKLDDVDNTLSVLERAIVLSQDRSAEGKIALLNLIAEKTDKKEVKENIVEVKTIVEKEKAKETEIKDKVSEDYRPID